ncbi:MAG: hypothetical protein H3C26_16055 [Rhodocyclaceae bacterium]|nr:hypothetical protein [Rhodocyclaceae bacterium]
MMKLKQKVIDRIEREAAQMVEIVRANAGLLAEAEVLSEKLRAHLPEECCTGCPVASVAPQGITVWVQFSPGHVSRHEIIAAITGAGLRIASESEKPWNREDTLIHLEGFDVPISVAANVTPRMPLAEAA